MKVEVKEKELHNKSRQGKYFYMKAKGKRGRYYKDEGIPLTELKKHYISYKKGESPILSKSTKEMYKSGTYRRMPSKIRLEKYKAKFPNKTNIVKNLRRNKITTSVLDDALTADEEPVRKSLKDHLKPLVKDSKLLSVLCLEENQQKLKNKYEHKIFIINENGETMAEFAKLYTTLREIIKDFQQKFTKGMSWSSVYEERKGLTKKYSGLMNNQSDKKSVLQKIRIVTVFRVS